MRQCLVAQVNLEDDEDGQNCCSCMGSSRGSNFDSRGMSTFDCETVKHMEQQSIVITTKNMGNEELPVSKKQKVPSS